MAIFRATKRICWRLQGRVLRRRRGGGTALAMFVDELQYVEEDQLAALITTLHRGGAASSFSIILVGAGLPQLRKRADGPGEWAYAERLFLTFPGKGPLGPRLRHRRGNSQACERGEGVEVSEEALRSDYSENAWLSLFSSRVGQTRLLGHPKKISNHCKEVTSEDRHRLQPLQHSMKVSSAFDSTGLPLLEKKVSTGDGGTRPKPAYSGDIAEQLDRDVTSLWSDPKPVDRQGHDLESEPRRHGIHCTHV